MAHLIVTRFGFMWWRLASVLLVIQLVTIGSVPGATSALTGSPHTQLQPQLVAIATEQPTAIVNVIVQKNASERSLEDVVVRLGGKVTKDLHMIHAFAAQLPASSVLELAKVGGVRWISLDGPMQSSINSSKFTTWSNQTGTAVANGFTNVNNMLGVVGKNNTYGYGGRVKGAFSGFQAEYTPGIAINKIFVRLHLYTAQLVGSTEVLKITPYVAGKATKLFNVSAATLNPFIGVSKAAALDIEITSARAWKWADLKTLQVVLDQTGLSAGSSIYYDAIGIRVFAETGTDTTSSLVVSSEADTSAINTSVLSNVFQRTTRAVDIWNESPYWQGSGVTVAVIDSGSFRTNAIGPRFIGEVNFNSSEHTANDQYGHGTFVTGLVADDGDYSAGKYTGIAPRANVLGLRVSDDAGMAYESDVVAAMQWVYTNKATYNIRVVNLSLNAALWQSYHTSPLDAAAEILWFSGVTVVVSAGNNGTATLYPPANDPFVITVGATDDLNTVGLQDDSIASFSAYGVDEANQVKPDLVAPGKNLIAYLPDNNQLTMGVQHPDHRVDGNYFRMSGTSVSAPLVSGAVAILLQANPTLTPDQVKYRLKTTANKTWSGYVASKAGAGYLDVYAAVKGTSTANANTGLQASQLLWTGSDPITWGSVNWNSVNWNSVNWNSVNWNSVNWNSVNWNSDHWDSPARSSNFVNESAILAEDVQAVDVEDEQIVPEENEETQGIQKVFLPVISN